MKISFGLSFFLAETADPISSIPCIFQNHVKYPSLPNLYLAAAVAPLFDFSSLRLFGSVSEIPGLYIPRDDNLADPPI